MNLYLYAHGNPSRYADPLGLSSCSDQIPRDLAQFLDAFNVFMEDPHLAMHEHPSLGRGTLSNIKWSIAELLVGDGAAWGTSCEGWNIGLWEYGFGKTALDTDCCRARDAKIFDPFQHTVVKVWCRSDTCKDDWFLADIFDTWATPHKPLYPGYYVAPVRPRVTMMVCHGG